MEKGLYVAKRGCDDITSFFVGMRTNMCKGSFTFVLKAEINEKTPILPTDGNEHPTKKGPLGRKQLIQTTDLVNENVLPWNVSCGETDRDLLCPYENLLCQITHHLRNIASLFLDVCHHCSNVIHQDHKFPHDPVPKAIQSQLDCLHL